MSTRVGVIGGGITGLSAAYQLVSDGHSVVLFEASSRLGGKIAETSIDGSIFPTGPDAFLARRPEVISLAQEVGLGDSLTRPSAQSARIFRNGRLHPLPPNVLGVPATEDLATTGLISPEGAIIAAAGTADIAAAGTADIAADQSVGDLVRRQLGDEVLEFLVDPLLGGINAGDSDRLSLQAGVPQLDALHRREGRLLDAAAATLAEAARNADPTAPPAPVFHGIEGGLGRLVDRLTEILVASDRFELHTETTAVLSPRNDAASGWLVNNVEVSHVISTIPAFATAQLLSTIDETAAELLRRIEYSSVALTVMTLAPGTIELDEQISGVLIPRTLGHHVTAVSFASHKWPHLAVGGRQVLRVSTGRRTDTRWVGLSDHDLVAAIEADLTEIFDVEVKATHAEVTRWKDALPQYDVGHNDTIEQIDNALDNHDGLTAIGAWRDGLGLPACVGSGRAAARGISLV